MKLLSGAGSPRRQYRHISLPKTPTLPKVSVSFVMPEAAFGLDLQGVNNFLLEACNSSIEVVPVQRLWFEQNAE